MTGTFEPPADGVYVRCTFDTDTGSAAEDDGAGNGSDVPGASSGMPGSAWQDTTIVPSS